MPIIPDVNHNIRSRKSIIWTQTAKKKATHVGTVVHFLAQSAKF